MKIKRSELNSLITEVAQNNEISKGIALIIDKQGCDTDEAITIYIKDNPEANETSITQALTDFPISNGMDKAFISENVDEVINNIIKELADEEEEIDPLEDPLEEPLEDPLEDPLEEPSEEETPEGLYGGPQIFNPDVQRALAIIGQVVNEPKEYYALMNGQSTPKGKPHYPGVLHMVVMNPREKRRAMRIIIGKRLGDLVMDYLETHEATGDAHMSEQLSELDAGGGAEAAPVDNPVDNPADNSGGGDSGAGEPDVVLMLKIIPRINKSSEYAQLLHAVLKHGVSGKVPQIAKTLQVATKGDTKLYQALLHHLRDIKKGQGS